ncbi:MAG: hypothetical protein SH850_15585 [Planctomycetaceae bacterium]|nr:hypothetical protein [Planctomycetaceae bacterium]
MWNRLFSRQALMYRSLGLIGTIPTCCALLVVLLMGVRWRRRGDRRGNYVILAAIAGVVQTIILPQLAMVLVYDGPMRIWASALPMEIGVHGSILVAWAFGWWAVWRAIDVRARGSHPAVPKGF